MENKDKCNNIISRPEDYPLFNIIYSGNVSKAENNESKEKENGEETHVASEKNCDQVFYDYLKDSASKCSQNYYIFLFKFVILFRECMNKFKPGLNTAEMQKGVEYTQIKNAESCPDLCNEFITEFLESADYFGMNKDHERLEFIEVIQHFCQWLFENKYTSSRLSLL